MVRSAAGLAVLGLGPAVYCLHKMFAQRSANGRMRCLEVLTAFRSGPKRRLPLPGVGGGIYTEAADVGADLGKVEIHSGSITLQPHGYNVATTGDGRHGADHPMWPPIPATITGREATTTTSSLAAFRRFSCRWPGGHGITPPHRYPSVRVAEGGNAVQLNTGQPHSVVIRPCIHFIMRIMPTAPPSASRLMPAWHLLHAVIVGLVAGHADEHHHRVLHCWQAPTIYRVAPPRYYGYR
jgi:hypothetical protein